MKDILNTGISNVRNVHGYIFGKNTLSLLPDLLEKQKTTKDSWGLFFIDKFFEKNSETIDALCLKKQDKIIFIDVEDEPTTSYINQLTATIIDEMLTLPSIIVGMGGGITMDVAKAVANLLTNKGRAEDYQGWDLVKRPGVYKIGIPTLSGTGAEATRTCVMTNKQTGLKLGMNSDFTVYDQLILDPELTKTVPSNQYFYTGMDAYIHCIESLNGSYRNAIGDAYSNQTIQLCRKVFHSEDMMSDENRSDLMVASYLGGCAIATSYVGVVHPFSAGLSVVFGIHHGLANCITMRAMEDFYPKEFNEFWDMVAKQDIDIPTGICRDLSDQQYEQLYASTVIHEKPLKNALGDKFKEILTINKVTDIFKKM